jgi:hypothetical protein
MIEDARVGTELAGFLIERAFGSPAAAIVVDESTRSLWIVIAIRP